MKDLILLGAGASVEAGLKDTKDMTQQLLQMSAESRLPTDSARNRLLRFVVGGLLFQQGVSGEDPLTRGVNVEAVFNAIDLLGHRHEAEFSPFVSSWHPVIEELARQRDTSWSEAYKFQQGFDRALADALEGTHTGAMDLYTTMWRIIDSRFSLDDSLFQSTLDWMVRALIKMVRIQDLDKVNYLLPLLRINDSEKRVIATLNYDSTVELAAKTAGISINLGIDDWTPRSYPRIEKGLQLLKLHGSADWELSEVEPGDKNPIPQTKITIHRDNNDKQPRYKPAVLFGGANKLTTRGPFLDILNAFRDELKQADRLTVIGYSFHDQHINDYIGQFLANRTTQLRIINGPNFSKSADGFARDLLDPRRPSDARERIQDLGLRASEGIQQCFGTN